MALQFPGLPNVGGSIGDYLSQINQLSSQQQQIAGQRLVNAKTAMDNQAQSRVQPTSIMAQIAQNQAAAEQAPSGADAAVAQNQLAQKTAALGPLFNTLKGAPSSPAFLKLASAQDSSLTPSYQAVLDNLTSGSSRRAMLSSTQAWRGMTPLQKSQVQVAMAKRGFTTPALQDMVANGRIYDVYSSGMSPQDYQSKFGSPSSGAAPSGPQAPTLGAMLQPAQTPVTFKDGVPSASAPVQQDQQPASSQPQLSPEAQNEADQAESYNIKQTTDQPIRVQRSYMNTASKLYNSMVPFVDTIKKYSGTKGSLNQIMDQVKASSGTDSPDYQQLLLFKQHLPFFTNEIRRAYGAQATDQETKTLNSALSGITLTQTPAQTVALFNQIGDMLDDQRGVLDQSIAQTVNNPVATKRVATAPAAKPASKATSYDDIYKKFGLK